MRKCAATGIRIAEFPQTLGENDESCSEFQRLIFVLLFAGLSSARIHDSVVHSLVFENYMAM